MREIGRKTTTNYFSEHSSSKNLSFPPNRLISILKTFLLNSSYRKSKPIFVFSNFLFLIDSYSYAPSRLFPSETIWIICHLMDTNFLSLPQKFDSLLFPSYRWGFFYLPRPQKNTKRYEWVMSRKPIMVGLAISKFDAKFVLHF